LIIKRQNRATRAGGNEIALCPLLLAIWRNAATPVSWPGGARDEEAIGDP
jgi:hypothetical protein